MIVERWQNYYVDYLRGAVILTDVSNPKNIKTISKSNPGKSKHLISVDESDVWYTLMAPDGKSVVVQDHRFESKAERLHFAADLLCAHIVVHNRVSVSGFDPLKALRGEYKQRAPRSKIELRWVGH